MKVKDLLQMDIDIDVYDDVCEELGIAFCGSVELTNDGKEHFAEPLEYEVKLHNNGADIVAIVCIDDKDDDVWERRLEKAKELFESLAGFCSCDDYEKWFKEI